MQSKSKKSLSFISAIVMLMTLLPSALFVNAATTISVDLLESSAEDSNNASFYDGNIVQFNNQSEWGYATFPFQISEAGEYKATVKYAGGGSAWFKVGLDSNEDLYGEGNWLNGSNDWGTPTKTRSANITLSSGNHTVTFGGQSYAKYAGFTLEKIGGSSGGEESSSTVDSSSTIEPAVADGFHVSGKKILDANDNEFIMRGINIGHAWLHGEHNQKTAILPNGCDTYDTIRAAARLGVNSIRFCLSAGQCRWDMSERWDKTSRDEVQKIISTCKENNVVAVLTIQDTTGSNDTGRLNNAVNYWIEIKDILNANKDTVILNIANEWGVAGQYNGQGGIQDWQWQQAYESAVKSLRDAGIGNLLMVDAHDWGHGASSLKDKGNYVAQADTLNNTCFSVHAYSSFGNAKDQIYNCQNAISVPLVVGEFGDDPDNTVDYCKDSNISYLAWSWIGNDGGAEKYDIAKDVLGLELTEYGDNIFNRSKGIANNSKLCSVYTQNNPSYTVTPKSSDSASGTVSSARTVNIGEYVTVTANANAGNHFEYWSIDGKKVSKSATYKFRPAQNTEIVANFGAGESSTKTLTLSSDTSMSYSDLGTNYVVPFIVNAGHGVIKVKITSGAKEWTNIFTDQSSISVSPSNGTEGKGTAGYNKKDPNFDTSIYSYCQNYNEYTINSKSPAGIYYVGVSGSANITIEITYENDDVSKYGSEDPDPHYIVTLQSSNTNNGTINGETFSKKNFMPGETLTFPTATANNGYTFKGYNDGENNLYQPGDVYSFAEGLTENEKITFTAVFEKNVGTYRDLPIISVTTKDNVVYDGTDQKELSVDAWISTYNTDLIDMNLAGITANGGELRGRGNSTWKLAKKPYRLKFGKKTSLLTNTNDKEKKWVLLADYADRTLLRNKTAFDLASKLDNIPFASKTQSVELYINGEYRGVYLVAQQTEDKDKRAGIGAVADDDPYDANFTATDDELKFLAELDAGASGVEEIYCDAYNHNNKQKYYTIKSGAALNPNVSGHQSESNNVYVKRIKKYLDDVDSAISSGNETRIRQYINVPSFVDMYILQEYAENADVGSASFYLSKYSDEIHGNKLFASPPWDFDRCFGNDTRGVNYNKLYVAKGETDDSDKTNVSKWFTALCSQSWFVKEIEKRFTQLEDDGAFNDLTNANTYEYWKTSTSFKANFEKWQVQGNSTGLGYGEVGAKGDLNKEINYLVDWIQHRFQKMHDTYYKADMKENYTVAVKSSDETMGTVAKNYLGNNRYTVTATPKSGYKFTGWTSTTTLSSGDAVYTFTATSDVTLTAHFEVKGIELPVYGDTLRLEAESAKTFRNSEVFTVEDKPDTGDFGAAASPADNPQWLKSNANKNGGKGEAYIPFTIPATAGNTTYNFSMCYANNGDTRYTKLSVYKLDSNGGITIDGKKYSVVSDKELTNQQHKFSDGAIKTIENVSLEAGQTYYIGMYGKNWASFDYVDITANSGNPFIVEDGCDFTFIDQFGNTLAKNSAKPVEKDGQMYYSPVAPANTTAQGYYLSAWEYTTNGETKVIEATDENDTKDKAPEYVNSELEKLAFPSGSEVTFKATYTIIGETKTLTVDGGDIYIPANKNDTEFTLKTNAQVARLKNFGEVRIQASPKQGETFQYWTLNEMIYSYDESFKYSMWSDSTFVAHYAGTETTKAPIAYVGKDVAISSMSSDKYKASIFTEYYVPEGMEAVEKGILYSSTSGFDNLKAVQNGNSDSTLTTPNKCAKLVSRDTNVANNETFMSLSGLLKGRDIYIRPYIIYRENGQTKVVYSNYIAHVNSGDTDICEVKEVSNF